MNNFRVRYSVATLEREGDRPDGKPIRRSSHYDLKAESKKDALDRAKVEIARRYNLPAEESKWPKPDSDQEQHQNRFSIEDHGPCQNPDDRLKKK